MGSSSSRPEDAYKRQEEERKYGVGGTEMPYIYSIDGMGGYVPNPNYAPEWSGGRNPTTGTMQKPRIPATWSGYPAGPISHPEGQIGNPHQQQTQQHHSWYPQQQQHGRPQQSNNPYRS